MRPETSSSSAFSSPSRPASPPTARKPIEDVWQAINLGFAGLPPSSADSAAARSSSVFHFGILPAAGNRNPLEPIGPHPLPPTVFASFGTNSKYGSSTPPLVFPSHGKRSRADGGGGGGKGGEKRSQAGEQWRKRRMKNRESAERSRARKQAYSQELENEVDRLKMENAKLRSILNEEENFAGAGSRLLPKKNTLCRTLTAPF